LFSHVVSPINVTEKIEETFENSISLSKTAPSRSDSSPYHLLVNFSLGFNIVSPALASA